MVAHTCKRHLRNTCEWHLIPANDMHLSRTNRHTKVYNRVFRQRSPTERRWAFVWHWELPKKKQVGLLYKLIVYSIGIPNDLRILVLIRCFTKMGVQELHKRAFDKYGHGRSTGTGTGLPYEWQRVFVGNFIMTRTVYQSPSLFFMHNSVKDGAVYVVPNYIVSGGLMKYQSLM